MELTPWQDDMAGVDPAIFSRRLSDGEPPFPQAPEVTSAEPITNDSLARMRSSGQLPAAPPPQQQFASDVDRVMAAVQAMGMPPEAGLRILIARGYRPDVLQQRMAERKTIDSWQNYDRTQREARAGTQAELARRLAESYEDPRAAASGLGLPSAPYSPTRDRADGNMRPKWRVEVDGEGKKWYVDDNGLQQPRPVTLGGGEQAAQLKELPTSELESLRTNTGQLIGTLRALGLARGENVEGQRGDTAATGLKGFVWDPILQRLDPAGVDTRAAIANIGSLKIKDRSGAAVPAAEMAVLRPFIPRETDDPQVVRQKLQGFVQEYAKLLESDMQYYIGAGRRVPVALREEVKRAADAARAVSAGAVSAQNALDSAANKQPVQTGGKPSPQQLIQMFLEAQRNQGGQR